MFTQYLLEQETLIAVVAPCLLSIIFLVFSFIHKSYTNSICLAYLLSLPMMYTSARWQITPEAKELFVLPIFSIVCFVFTYRNVRVAPPLGFALAFISGLLIDIVCAVDLAHLMPEVGLTTFYQGIGGAGNKDGLFIVPIFTYLTLQYAQFRQGYRLAWL